MPLELQTFFVNNIAYTPGLPTVPHFGVQYPILGYSTPFRPFVPHKNLHPWGTHFVPHLDFSFYTVDESSLSRVNEIFSFS